MHIFENFERKGEISSNERFLRFPQKLFSVSPHLTLLYVNYLDLRQSKICPMVNSPKQQILDSSKLKELTDNNFKFDKNGRKFSKWVENTAKKGEIALYEHFLFISQRFQNTCTADT